MLLLSLRSSLRSFSPPPPPPPTYPLACVFSSPSPPSSYRTPPSPSRSRTARGRPRDGGTSRIERSRKDAPRGRTLWRSNGGGTSNPKGGAGVCCVSKHNETQRMTEAKGWSDQEQQQLHREPFSSSLRSSPPHIPPTSITNNLQLVVSLPALRSSLSPLLYSPPKPSPPLYQ